MRNFFGILSLVVVLSGVGYASNPASILQVNVYEYDAVHGLYDLIQQGSAVVIDTTTAVTNAHVVADEEGDTPYFYEVCKTTNPSANPECFSSAVIKKIRTEKDLAVLKFSAQSDIVPVVFTTEEIALGDEVTVLGYPANGGETITQTEGKISGFDGDYYKTDANLDSGNSGGGAFNQNGELIGIPTFVSVGYSTLGYIVPLAHVNEVLYATPTLPPVSTLTFDTFLRKNTLVGANDMVVTNAYQLNGYENLGFELDVFRQGTDTNAPSFLQMSTPTGDTVITVDTYTVNNESVLMQVGDTLYQESIENFSLAKNKIVTIGDNTWEATFLAGVEGLPALKSLNFTLRESDTNLSYTIMSVERDDQAFVDALVLFLKNFQVEDTEVAMPSTVQDVFEMLAVPYETVTGSYGYDESGETVYQFVLNETPILPNTMQILQYEVTQEFKDISYYEFAQYIRDSIDMYDLEGVGEGVSLEDSFFARNSNNVLFLVQPMYYSDEEQQVAAYSIVVVIESEEVATQYMMNLYASNQNDMNDIISFLDALDANALTDPFGSLGVDENSIVQVQNIVLAD